MLEPLFNNVTGLSPATLLKKTLAQVFSCEFCENSKNIFFYRIPPVAASEYLRTQYEFPVIRVSYCLNSTLTEI